MPVTGEPGRGRPGGDRVAGENGRHRLVRRVLCVRGAVPFRVRVAPRFGYGTQPHTARAAGEGMVVFESADLSLALAATVPVDCDGRDATAEFKLAEGQCAVFTLESAAGAVPPLPCTKAEAEEQAVHRDGCLLAALAGRLPLPRLVAGDGAPFRADAQAAHLRADRRDGRRADH
jgi:hypothetical protein